MTTSEQIPARLQFSALNPMFPSEGGIDQHFIDAILEKYPEGRTWTGWESRGATFNDDYLTDVLKYAQSIGIVIPPDCSATKSGVDYRVFPASSKDQRNKSPFVVSCLVKAIPAEIGFAENGTPFAVNDSRLKKGRKFEIGGAFAFPEFILVREATKSRILEAGLKGLSFAKMKVGENRLISDPEKLSADWPEGIEPLYLMTSEVELPVCKNWMFDDSGRVFHPRDRDFESKMYYPLNGRENMGPLHYSTDEIAPFLEFDVVRTYEHYIRNQPKILVSKRFREVFRQLGIKGMKYDLGFYTVIDKSPWELGTDGPLHPRYSGPPPNPPVD